MSRWLHGLLQQLLVTPPALVRWLNRASFGATPALVAEVQALGGSDDARWQVWVDQQLDPAAIADPEVDARITPARYPTLFKTLTQLWTDHHGETANFGVRMRPVSESECAKLVRATYSRRQAYEVLVDFWHDHFSTFGWHYDGGTVFDSSWDKGAPTQFATTDVVPGFKQALEGQTVGSQVVAVIPPADGYGDHIRRAAEWAHSGRAIVVRYEELHRDAVAELTRVTDAIEPADRASIEAAIEACSADNMRQMSKRMSFHVRAATVGDSRGKLTEPHLAIFRERYGKLVSGLGYEVR